MELVEIPLTANKIKELNNKYGNYFKLTIDTEEGKIVAGCELHADGEKILLEKGSKQENIWGGGIDLVNKEIDTTAVLNYRPNLNNNSMEILDPVIRNKFIVVVKNIFAVLLHFVNTPPIGRG